METLFQAQRKCYLENTEMKTPNLKLVIIAAIIAAVLFYFAILEQKPMLFLWAAIFSAAALYDGIKLYINHRRTK